MAKHRKELLSKECVTMVASGFDSDPQFVIISMPNTEDQEKDQEKDADRKTEETDAQADGSAL